jgi:hypothetical protein
MATKKAKTPATHPHEKRLAKAGLVKSGKLTTGHRKRIAKLSHAEVRALVSAKRKLGYKGTMHGAGADLF